VRRDEPKKCAKKRNRRIW